MGSPEFAANILESLHNEAEVVGVFTQPDKPVGRKQELTPPPAAIKAKELNLPLFQPISFKNSDALEALQSLSPDVIIVAAYGQILPQSALDVAPCINLHASLLPRHRGASALQSLLLNGEKYSGVTAIMMTSKLDAGDILGFVYFKHPESAKWDCLLKRLSFMGADLILSVINNFASIKPLKQKECLATYAPKVSKNDGLVEFNNADSLYRKFQAYHPWPGVFLDSGLKLFEVSLINNNINGSAGKIAEISKDGAIVECLVGKLFIKEVQAAGKKRMGIVDYLRGARIGVGAYLA
ncbi:MAG: hypothetical protein RL154_1612 [Pseudomonadota bacterium]